MRLSLKSAAEHSIDPPTAVSEFIIKLTSQQISEHIKKKIQQQIPVTRIGRNDLYWDLQNYDGK